MLTPRGKKQGARATFQVDTGRLAFTNSLKAAALLRSPLRGAWARLKECPMAGVVGGVKWGVWTDLMEPYRYWQVICPVPESELLPGDTLYQRAAPSKHKWEGHRFQVRGKRDGDDEEGVLENLEDWQAATLFGGDIPPWPLEGDV